MAGGCLDCAADCPGNIVKFQVKKDPAPLILEEIQGPAVGKVVVSLVEVGEALQEVVEAPRLLAQVVGAVEARDLRALVSSKRQTQICALRNTVPNTTKHKPKHNQTQVKMSARLCLNHKPNTTKHKSNTSKHKLHTTKHKLNTTKHKLNTTKHKLNTTKHKLNTTKHKPEHNRTQAAVPEPRMPNTARLCLKHMCLETLNTTKH